MTARDKGLPHEVVIVDDHEDTRELTAELLQMEGFLVRPFATAEAALADVARLAPSAVISDLTLEGLSGEDLARRLRGSPQTRHIALIAVTGHAGAADNVESLWDRVLIKPVDPSALAQALRDVLAAPRP